ncbi:MAG TPA: tripartite tricarboxylate transporter substrate binding protein [Xanthobacteraceae bacterium]|jgi:tripartite-type tricarboxylate transporter receptor subunit TctC
MKLPRRRFLQLSGVAAALCAASRTAGAQSYPARPVSIVVGFAPGGPTDLAARLIGQWLSERLGQPFIVENRPGAATNIATEAVAHAAPDGYALLAAVSSNTINPTLYPKLTFNFIRDLAMVGGVHSSPLILEVNPSVPVNSVPELIAYAKANPGRISLASFGAGTISHVAGELFKLKAGIQMLHVPYRGSAPMVIDLLSGQVNAAIDNVPSSLEHIKAGKLRALAVTTTARSPALPQVPTLADFQPGFEASAWIGIAAPRKTPAEIIHKLNKEINAGLADPKIAARIAEWGATALAGSPADLDRLVADRTEQWAKVIRAAKIQLD